ncbi:MAG: hypothetical protein A2452_12455 [Candidatus Firestonebacteria bacterium RIFOXYC2_FULL_39_67]|nr:MAG: hypothetical protein A2452_12455 [Candidatus Firestonebacteria bacterium RIFOXYC2_FULL_39_67]OGF55351.1 MAG: hypothetical protein A2497_00615 [Candidatus Firestonebacteria bacterium RifOxyC12_full_39_7]
MEKIDILEQKIRKALEEYNILKKENLDLKDKIKELEVFKADIGKLRDKRDKAKSQVDDIIDTIDKIQLDLKL